MKEKIRFIGLGIMGRARAICLVKAGYSLWVHARRPDIMEALTDVRCFGVRWENRCYDGCLAAKHNQEI